jgi:predicted pyridoxine 5'-phosphate oxidase superfamily flavin-nucleotide-binding protein
MFLTPVVAVVVVSPTVEVVPTSDVAVAGVVGSAGPVSWPAADFLTRPAFLSVVADLNEVPADSLLRFTVRTPVLLK